MFKRPTSIIVNLLGKNRYLEMKYVQIFASFFWLKTELETFEKVKLCFLKTYSFLALDLNGPHQ